MFWHVFCVDWLPSEREEKRKPEESQPNPFPHFFPFLKQSSNLHRTDRLYREVTWPKSGWFWVVIKKYRMVSLSWGQKGTITLSHTPNLTSSSRTCKLFSQLNTIGTQKNLWFFHTQSHTRVVQWILRKAGQAHPTSI